MICGITRRNRNSPQTADNSADKLAQAGFFCVNAGPSNWLHCLRLSHFGNPSVPVMVYSEDGIEFKGTELLLRPDIYAGQPCRQDGGDTWDYNAGLDYMACHHFHTGHH
jgi:hypothetical protein